MNHLSNSFPSGSSDSHPDWGSMRKNSPVTVTEVSVHGSNEETSKSSLKKVATNPLVKSILKSQSAYAPEGKISTLPHLRSVRFASNSIANDGEERPTKFSSIKNVTPPGRRGPGSSIPRSSKNFLATSTPQAKNSTDAAIEKVFQDAGNKVSQKIKTMASSMMKFAQTPEDFFIPKEKK